MDWEGLKGNEVDLIGTIRTVSHRTRVGGCRTSARGASDMPLSALLERVSSLGNGFFVALWIVVVTLLVWQRWRRRNGGAGDAEGGAQGETDAVKPVHCGDITLEELRAFDGRDPTKPLYVAVRGKVYDVTRGKQFYGPGQAYSCFTGR